MNDGDFKNLARQHQIEYRNSVLSKPAGEYPTWLNADDARQGHNLYLNWPGLFEAAKKRYEPDKKLTDVYQDMLRSEHIPLNLFVPLQHEISNPDTLSFLNHLLPDADIQEITNVEIEYVWPVDRNELLDDRTSFDAYIGYRDGDNNLCGIGIEVKYTEKSYPYGDTEKKRMFDPDGNSPYHKATKSSSLYLDNSIPALREPALKQVWRNHLLGEKMRQNGGIKKFTSVHLYPKGNQYQTAVCNDYINLLTAAGKKYFVKITYEEFIRLGRESFSGQRFADWLDYLERRYIVNME